MFGGIWSVMKPTVYKKFHFWWPSRFQLLLHFDKWLLPVLKELSGLLLVLMMFEKGCLLIIIYKVLVGNGAQKWLDWFSSMSTSWQWWKYAFTLIFIDNYDFNKSCLLVIIYKVLLCDGNQNWFDWFSQYVLSCGCWWHCAFIHWWSWMMMALMKSCLLVLIYKVLAFRIGFTDFPSMSFHAATNITIMTVVYVFIYIDVHWW